MFDRIGEKIKSVAKVIFWFGVVVGLIVAYFIGEAGHSYVAIFVFLVSFLISWLGTYLLYGFGELVDNSRKILDRLERFPIPNDRIAKVNENPQPQPETYNGMKL